MPLTLKLQLSTKGIADRVDHQPSVSLRLVSFAVIKFSAHINSNLSGFDELGPVEFVSESDVY